MELLIINQPAGIGDILAIQKIAYVNAVTHEVKIPVINSLRWLVDYLPFVTSNANVGNQPFKLLDLDGAHLQYPGSTIMEGKYQKAGVSMIDYLSYIKIKRNRHKEQCLYGKLVSNERYRFVCNYFGTPVNDSKLGTVYKDIKVPDDMPNVRLEFIEGYTLFDWISIIENASEIYSTDTSVQFLIELFNIRADKRVIFSRRPNIFEFRGLFSKEYIYVV